MKKAIRSMQAIRRIAAIALIAMIGLAVIACGGGGRLNGTYKLDLNGADLSYTFSGNKVTASSGGSVIGELTFSTSNGVLTMRNEDGDEEKFPYKLEGNRLTMGEGAFQSVFIKQ